MRKLYLIRHGKPELPPGCRICLGRTDPGLSPEGHAQAALLAGYMGDCGITGVFCSPLLRSRQTAEHLSAHPVVVPGLEEQDQGAWDGLSFREIQKQWPGIYEQRGLHPGLEPPGGEASQAAAKRFLAALKHVLSISKGDVAVVSHQGVIQLFLCMIADRSFDDRMGFPLAYGAVFPLLYENGRFWPEERDTEKTRKEVVS